MSGHLNISVSFIIGCQNFFLVKSRSKSLDRVLLLSVHWSSFFIPKRKTMISFTVLSIWYKGYIIIYNIFSVNFNLKAYWILRFNDNLNQPFKNMSFTKMKLLASLILPSFCQNLDIKPAFECGINEKWNSCGHPCNEENCQDRVHKDFLSCEIRCHAM